MLINIWWDIYTNAVIQMQMFVIHIGSYFLCIGSFVNYSLIQTIRLVAWEVIWIVKVLRYLRRQNSHFFFIYSCYYDLHFIQLEKATEIHSIDIGNEGSAFVEVLVGKSTSTSDQDYEVINQIISKCSILLIYCVLNILLITYWYLD